MNIARMNSTAAFRLTVSICFALLTTAAQIAMAQSTELDRFVQTHPWVTDAGAHSVPATDTLLPSSPPLSAEERALVRLCLARYGVFGVPDGTQQAEATAERAARVCFNAMPRAEIERRLVPIRKALYRGTRAYTSVAFVLACYDIDFERNALRVVEAISLDANPPAKLKAAGFKRSTDDDDPAGALNVADAVDKLYRKHHSAILLRAYLHAPVDGATAESADDTLTSLFTAYPAEVLRAASDLQDMKILAGAVRFGTGFGVENKDAEASRNKLQRLLRRLANSDDPEIARLSRRFRRILATEETLRKHRVQFRHPD